jgi:hypothetical protein
LRTSHSWMEVSVEAVAKTCDSSSDTSEGIQDAESVMARTCSLRSSASRGGQEMGILASSSGDQAEGKLLARGQGARSRRQKQQG